MVSIGRTFPEIGRLFYQTGPDSAYQIVATWIAKQQGSFSKTISPITSFLLLVFPTIAEIVAPTATAFPPVRRRLA
jgi:hypothetical protein